MPNRDESFDPAVFDGAFPLLPLRSGVLFPGTVITVPVGRARSAALFRAVQKGAVIGVAVQRDPKIADPVASDLHHVGTLARVHQVARAADGSFNVVLEGLRRFELTGLAGVDPYWRGEGRAIEEPRAADPEAQLLAEALRERVAELGKLHDWNPVPAGFERDEPAGVTADKVVAGLNLPTEAEVDVLLRLDVVERLRKVAELLAQAKAMGELRRKIQGEVRRELSEGQRQALLRQQLRAIQRELGEGEDGDNDVERLRARLDPLELAEDVRKVVERELRKLESLNPGQPEYGVVRNYLELIADLPWSARASTTEDVDQVAAQLDADHYGLRDVKQRILEHVAVMRLSGSPRGSILAFSGPPGVGKTSLGRSIAQAMGRPFVRVSLGGVRDEADVRGHRRTYVGALPGRIIDALRRAKVKNPVVMLDELDKVGRGWQGNPEAALLEVLDPEQNAAFTDHYLDLPFDLSEVMFIATVNQLDALAPPLRDRLEVIDVSGYTPEEKRHIARDHLLPKQLRELGLDGAVVEVTDEALEQVVRDYTREAGVRQLTRQLVKLTRGIALEVARRGDAKAEPITVGAAAVTRHLGKPRFFAEMAERTSVPGVATGLAWTPVGGDILFVETSAMPGRGKLEITGQLGDVMRESARAALTYVRANAERLGVAAAGLETQDLHIHVPAGAVPKDGPSAGVTMFTALTSLLTGRRVRADTAMTGEATLRGRVLPVGGIKEKLLAAHRAGIVQVIVPARNERDLDDVPADVLEQLRVVLVHDMTEVLDAALEPEPALASADPAASGVHHTA
jgi:ATP-dependent Lon protease